MPKNLEKLTLNELRQMWANAWGMEPHTGYVDDFQITVPYKTGSTRRGAIVIEPKDDHDVFDLPSNKLKKLVQGMAWRDEHFDGLSLKEIAAREGCSQAYVGTAIFQSFEVLQSA